MILLGRFHDGMEFQEFQTNIDFGASKMRRRKELTIPQNLTNADL
jgi:hypothetical protein